MSVDVNAVKVVMDAQETLEDLQELWESEGFQSQIKSLSDSELKVLIHFKHILKLKFKRDNAYRSRISN